MDPLVSDHARQSGASHDGFTVLRLLLLTALLMPMTAQAGDGHNCQRDSGQNMERKKQKC